MTHDHDAVSDGRRHQRLAEPATLRLHVRLDEVFPPVWRRIEVASDLGLDDLHEVLQVVFDWEDAHLHRFTTGPQLDPGQAFVAGFDLLETWDDEDGGTPEWQVRLDELLAAPGERLHYQYDYGDNWWLTLELEDTDPDGVPAGRAVCIEGAGAPPPEDCGGTPGYELLVGAVDPGHPDHGVRRVEFARMYGSDVDPASFGLQPFDVGRVNDGLVELDLDSRPATPSAVGPALTTLLIRARTPQTHLRLRAMAAAVDQPVEIDVATATTMTHAYRWLLHRLGDDGVKLTAAGYLPPVTRPGRVRGARSGRRVDRCRQPRGPDRAGARAARVRPTARAASEVPRPTAAHRPRPRPSRRPGRAVAPPRVPTPDRGTQRNRRRVAGRSAAARHVGHRHRRRCRRHHRHVPVRPRTGNRATATRSTV